MLLLIRYNNDLASIRCYIKPVLPFEKEPVRRQHAGIKTAPEGVAPERADVVKIPGIDKDPPLAVVAVVNEIEQLPGRGAVKISSGFQMKIIVACS